MEILVFLLAVVTAAWFVSQLIAKRLVKTRSSANNPIIPDYKDEQTAAVLAATEDDEEEGPPDFQPLLTKAVEHKQAKEWGNALSCLDQAYQLATSFPPEYCEGAYLRLPYYLQLAGDNDEAWKCLNNLRNGVVPHRVDQPCGLEMNIYWRLKVEDKMRLFLEKEKRYKEALRWRCTNLYLTAVTQFRLATELDDSSRATRYGIPALTEKLAKPVERATLKPEATEKLASTIFVSASNTKSHEHALAEFINVIAQISDVIKQAFEREVVEKKESDHQPLQKRPRSRNHQKKSTVIFYPAEAGKSLSLFPGGCFGKKVMELACAQA
jgi:hypothetical protein